MQKGEEATKRILFKVQQITNNQFVWDVSEKKINLVRHRLENGIKEQDLVDFIENRYNYLKENDCKYTNFTIEKLLADENEKHIKAFIKSKTPKADSNTKSRDGVKSITYTKAEIEEFKRRAAEIEAAGEQGVF